MGADPGARGVSLTRDEIAAVLRSAERPLLLREILARLDVPRHEARKAHRLVRDMARDGLVAQSEAGRFALAAPPRVVTGVLTVARGGYGFVRPDDGAGSAERRDVFVPKWDLGGALHGDRVTARITDEKADGRLEGTITSVVEHAHRVVLGVYEPEGPARNGNAIGWVTPLDTRVALRLRVATPAPLDPGTVVEVRVASFPARGVVATADLTHVIGPRDDPRFDVAIVCRKYGLTEEFPDAVARTLPGIPAEVRSEECAGRADFRDDLVFTIDPETAKDFDDAIAIARRPGSGYRLWVHIADVSHYVTEGSPLDVEAARRGTSVYFPGFVVPMLPHPLSSAICSLKPHVDRLVVSAIMDLDASGRLESSRFVRGVIRSAARFTYPEAQRILDGDAAERERHPTLVEPLLIAEQLARILRQRRRERGSIDFDLPEAEILWDMQGEMAGIVPADASFTHKLIEEFMLLANEAVATRLSRRLTIYRVHEKPTADKLEALADELGAFGIRLDGDFDDPTPQMFQALLARVEGKREGRIVSTLALRSMMLARYDTDALGHFGLAAPLYTHFTSPIRRYPDLVVHRLLCEEEGLVPHRPRDVAAIARESSARERIAQDAEREVMAVKKARFMFERIGEEYDGIVLSVDKAGLWVELEDYLIDGFVPIATLDDDAYELVPRRRSLVGVARGRAVKLGDRVRIRVDRVDMERKMIDFAIVWPDRSAGPARESRKTLKALKAMKREKRRMRAPSGRDGAASGARSAGLSRGSGTGTPSTPSSLRRGSSRRRSR